MNSRSTVQTSSSMTTKGAWRPLMVAALALVALYMASELYLLDGRLGFPLDDSWIHLQLASQLAAGEGMAFNPGRWISASTAPLWTALLSLAFVLPGSALAWTKLLGILLFLATLHATLILAAELGLGARWQTLAGTLVLTTPWLLWSALSGMEILLFTVLSLWGMILHLRERGSTTRLAFSLPVFAVAALARPEGYLLLALAVGERLSRRHADAHQLRRLGEGLAAAIVLLAPVLIFYRLTGGSFLPTTFAVKASSPGDLIPNGRYLETVLHIFFRSQPILLLLAGAGALRLVAGLGGRRDRGLLLAAWPMSLALIYALLAPDRGPVVVGNFGRYYFPLIPVVILLGLLGLEPTWKRLRPRLERHRLLRICLLLTLVAPNLWKVAHGPARYAQCVANVEDSDVAAARWLAGRLPGEALLAVQDIGAVKFHLPNRVLDLTGIVNPEILPFLKSEDEDPVYWERRLFAFLEQERPDYLLVFGKSYPMLTTATPGIEPVAHFTIRNNVTMAGDDLVLCTTPWTRFPLREPEEPSGSSPR